MSCQCPRVTSGTCAEYTSPGLTPGSVRTKPCGFRRLGRQSLFVSDQQTLDLMRAACTLSMRERKSQVATCVTGGADRTTIANRSYGRRGTSRRLRQGTVCRMDLTATDNHVLVQNCNDHPQVLYLREVYFIAS